MDEKTEEQELKEIDAMIAKNKAETDAAAKSFCDLLTATQWGFEPQDRMNAAIALVSFIRNAALTGREMHVLNGCLKYAKQNEQ
tara:strand:+ start:319 stop:570 length:252 start_codon:yes stop_codon:yes gene_type:complete